MLADRNTNKAYDEFGKPTSVPSQLIERSRAMQWGSGNSDRLLVFRAPLAKDVQVVFDEGPPIQPRQDAGYYYVPFPESTGDLTQHYKIFETADNWQTVGTWDSKHSNPNVQVQVTTNENQAEVLMKSLPYLSTDRVLEEYEIESSPKREYPSEQVHIPYPSNPTILEYIWPLKEPIEALTTLHRSLRVAKEGYIAFGKAPNMNDRPKADNSVSLQALYEFPKPSTSEVQKWSPAGKALTALRNEVTRVDINDQREKRTLLLQFLVGAESVSFNLPPKENSIFHLIMGEGGTVRSEGKYFRTLAVLVNPNIHIADLDVELAAGPFIEVARTTKIFQGTTGLVPEGSAVIEDGLAVKNKERPFNCLIKVSDRYNGWDYQASYIDASGKERPYFSTTRKIGGYVGIPSDNFRLKKSEIHGLVLRARPYVQTTIKGVHLYPQSSTP